MYLDFTISENLSELITKLGDTLEVQVAYDNEKKPKSIVIYLDADKNIQNGLRTHLNIELFPGGRKVRAIRIFDPEK